jgi:hypothetical protein
MSGIAAAKKRRANISPSVPDQPRLSNGGLAAPQQAQGLTLQQVIELLNTRLLKVEKAVAEYQPEDSSRMNMQDSINKIGLDTLPSNISEILDDFQEKFIILAGEINSLKDTVLKLQSYTMDVNKTLLEERIQIISELDNTDDNHFVLESTPQQNISFDVDHTTYSIGEE